MSSRDDEPASCFIYYGDDWPPAPELPKGQPPARRRRTLGERCLLIVLAYAVIVALGFLAVHIRDHVDPFQLRSVPDSGTTAPAHP